MIISLFKKGDREDPGNYRGITLLNVVGKLFNKVLNYRLLQWLEEHNKLSESQAGFRGFFDEYSFKRLCRETCGQWQKCYGKVSMSIYFYYLYIYI